MNEEIAVNLLPLVNDPLLYDDLLGYVNYRINVLRGFLETEKSPQRVLEIQGSIQELRVFLTLRESVHNIRKP